MNTLMLILPIIGLIAGLGGLIFAFWVHKQTLENRQATQEKLSRLAEQSALMTTGAIGMGHRLLALESKLQTLREEQIHDSPDDAYPYGQAMQLFDQGADVETVAASCGLSNSEANLMSLVRRQIRERKPVDEALTD